MLCSVVYIVVITCFGISHFFILFLGFDKSDGALPPGADEIVLIDHLPGRQVHLQDFFWTRAEDAPLWVDPNQLLTLYETRTIHHTATVYPPDENEQGPEYGSHSDPNFTHGPFIPGCTSCIDPTPTQPEADQDVGILIVDDPGPRYWLLTVLRGENGVPPKVELRLARLYRKAFRRQQESHLGLLGDRTRRESKNHAMLEKKPPNITHTTKHAQEVHSMNNIIDSTIVPINKSIQMKQILPVTQMRLVRINSKRTLPFKETISQPDVTSLIDNTASQLESETMASINSAAFKSATEIEQSSSWNTIISIPLNNDESFSQDFNHSNSLNVTENQQMFDDLRFSRSIGLVQVKMQNTSVIDRGTTKLIYSVHLSGKPVPAETAAKDMALLSPQEVALELGTPVLIQSEPYLKPTGPMALSRKRDVYLLMGAAGAAVLLLIIIIIIIILVTKKKKAQSAVAAPPIESNIKKDRKYTLASLGHDNTEYTSETELRTDGSSQRRTPGSNTRTPVTPRSPDTLEGEINDLASENEEDEDHDLKSTNMIPWDECDYLDVTRKTRSGRGRIIQTKALNITKTPDSMDSIECHSDTLESMEKGFILREEAPISPNSYLSLPSCKPFPNMKSVEPLSRILEPVVVKHLDIELDTPDLQKQIDFNIKTVDNYLKRATSTVKDPGVVGPIVWDLRRNKSVEDTKTFDTDFDPTRVSHGPVGRARRRLHELLEDSFSLFGSREAKTKEDQSNQYVFISRGLSDHLTILSETRGKSANVSPVTTPTSQIKSRPRSSVPRTEMEELIQETENMGPHPRGAWGSRPLSAGPFHRPNLPEVNTMRLLADSQLLVEDPAVPLINRIKQELKKFSAD
ncbi:uncharacterized protein LOC117176311 isoform X2 [Belonocnema kinseyi]|uniref:uncharacterized protein LOC117176311 isoform X2 n=1 Tax=Belonocnema kinseyi TaxID=2817044 RepID=UPI00143CC78D|nr:uncharacterized protein LOC117176311 isoform X2 [Belonocnema kinseyi]